MKKLKLFFACLLMAVLSIGQVWAAEELKATIDFASNDFEIPTSKTVTENTYTYDGISMTLVGTSGNGYAYYSKDKYLLNGKQGATITFSAFTWKTTKIVVTGRSGASGSTKMNIFVGEEAASTETTGSTGTNTYNIAADKQAAGTIYTLKVTSAHNAQFTKFEIYGEAGGDDPTPVAVTGVTLDQSEAEVAVGKTITLTPTVAPSDATTKTVTWESNDEDVATVEDGVVTGVAEGTATITVKTVDGNKTATCEVTVTPAPAAVNYEKVTAEPADWSGEYLLVYEADATNARVWKGADQANNYAEATISAGVIAAPEGAAVLTIAKVAESSPVVYTIKVGEKYIGQTSDGNGMKIQDAAINNSISYNTTDDAVDIVASSAHLRYNNASSSYFRYYKSATYSSQKKIQLYKKVDGTVKPSAELSYATADQKKLTKLGEAFTAPTLVNPHTVAVTYASNNTAVVEVASNGAVTIKAAGVATITASYDGSGDYKTGSASYTIGVTTHAGTEADPYVAADAKNVIDAVETKENAYVSGKISSIYTTSTSFDSETGYISFYISADGNTTGQQIEAFKCLGLSGAKFTEVTDVVEGADVLITGTLKKFKSTYELDQDCYLVSYNAPEEPKTPIVSDIDHPITVANAITYIDAPATYDLSQAVWVRGVVTAIGQTSGDIPVPYIDVKDADVENSFRFFDYTINASITDEPQVGDILIATGLLDKYKSTYELNGCEVVSLVRPEVPVTSVAMTESTAEVEVNSTVTLHASVLPENASNKAITWSVQSGSEYATVDAGVVTGILAGGTAVIRAASTADPTKYAECTVTVTAADPTKHKVTFDATIDISDQETSITKSGITITASKFNNNEEGKYYYQCYASSAMTVSSTVGNITNIELTCTASGTAKYGPGNWEFTGYSYDGTNGSWAGSAETVEFGTASQQVRMTLITVTYKEDSRAEAGLAWNPADDIEITVGDAFSAPTLNNPNSIAAGEITIASDNTDLATVSEGVVSLVADATGTATITATFEGNDDYKPATVSYNITVNAAAPTPLTDYYEKVTETAGIVEGTYLIVYEDGENSLAFNGGLETLDAESNTIAVTITNDNKIGVTTETAAATFYIDPVAGTVKSASNHYIGVSSWGNGLKQNDTYVHNVLEIDGDGNAQVGIYNADWNTTGGTMRLQYNKGAGQTRFRYFKNGGQQPIALYKLANETVKADPELAWSADVDQIIDVAFTSPTLNHAAAITGTITYESDNESVATVSDAGVISLTEPHVTGTAHITATYEGDENFKSGSAVCTIKINPAHSIYVDKLSVNFGSVAKEAPVADQTIVVTLTNVDAATATLSGSGASAFSIDPAALIASGNITISASSATAGTFSATLTISDDAGEAASKNVSLKLTVTDPADEETPISTSSEWVAATEIADGMQVLITGVKDEVVYAMGEQKSTNRAAYVATLNEGVLTPGEGTMAFTLVAQGDGTYAIRTSNGKYLYAAASGNNHLKTQDEVDVNAKWTLTVASAVAESSTNRNVMQFNGSGTNKLFSCYGSDSQEDIQLYVPKPVTPPTPVYTEVRGDLEAGRHYTVCLEKNVTAVKGATFWSLTYKNSDGTIAYLVKEEAPFAAGTPYIFQATDDNEGKLEVVYGTETATKPVENGVLRGTFSDLSASQLNALTDAGQTIYMLFNNELRPIGTDNHLDAHRAYVRYDLLTEAPTSNFAPGKTVKGMPMQKDQAQGFENLDASEKPLKVMIDGTLYILRGEKVYDATGRLVK